ncbi:MAG: hypothetical protein Ct9H300mP16_17910 [Pseudomonadota bacterium]|nr:MAG: hypothetical protein Ct9H300mP16_17910 [Pseudomonadota bacterium]
MEARRRKLSGGLPSANGTPRSEQHLAAHGTEIFVTDLFAGQFSHSYNLEIGTGDHLPVFPDWPAESFAEAEYPVLFPNTLLGLQADHLFVMVVIPLAYDRTREETRLYVPATAP